MNIDQFLINLDTLGVELEKWPHSQAEQAQALLASSLDAQQALAAAQHIEMLFSQDTHKAPTDLVNSIVKISQNRGTSDNHHGAHANTRNGSLFSFTQWPSVIATAIPLIISFALGLGLGLQPAEEDDYADLNSWVYADSLTQSTIDFSTLGEGFDNDAT